MSGTDIEKVKPRARVIRNYCVLVLLGILIVLVFMGYSRSSQKRIESYACETVAQNARAISQEVDANISFAFNSIQLTSHLAEQTMNRSVLEDASIVLNELRGDTPFNFIEYIDAKGINRTTEGEEFDASDKTYFVNGIAGRTGIWINFHPRYASEYLLDFYTPLYYRSAIVGVLAGTLGAETNVLPLLSMQFFGEKTTGILIDEKGQVISSTEPFEGDTYLSDILSNQEIDAKNQEIFAEHIQNKDPSVFQYDTAQGRAVACVIANARTGWSVLQIVPAASFEAVLRKTSGDTFVAIGLIAGFLLLYLMYYALEERSWHRKIIQQKEKKLEEQVLLSNMDRLTGCANRRAYEDDMMRWPDIPTEPDYVYVSADVNGLKVINDTKGHAAGDELLKGAVMVLNQCLGPYGKIYRIGGDEFAAMIFASEEMLEFIRKDLTDTMIEWHGEKVDSLSISFGFAARREFIGMTVAELAKKADERMYKEKAAYYMSRGIDRRGQQTAYAALCASYKKILRINLTVDTYQILVMDNNEQTEEKGFSKRISDWLHNFGRSGQVHPDDLSHYLERTDLNYLRKYFHEGKRHYSLFYRRRFGEIYREVLMEMIPAEDYGIDNETLYLYVKDIDKVPGK